MGATDPEDFQVQRRTPRDEAMEHMLAATVELLVERPPEKVTIRDVAEASGHHHRFVQSWFGGKVPLFRAAFDRLSLETADRVSEDLSGSQLGERSVGLARLLNWLVAADPESFQGDRPTPLIDRVSRIYADDLGIESDLARLLAMRTVGMSVSFMLFGDALGLSGDDIETVAALDREMIALLAEDRRNRPPA